MMRFRRCQPCARFRRRCSRLRRGQSRRIRELQAQIRELQNLNRELQSTQDVQREFLSNVSHELRTPLTSIQAYCELLLMFGDEDPETRREFLENIDHECRRLGHLINRILDVSKMEAGKMEWNMKPNDLLHTIQRAVKAMWSVANEKGLELQTELPESVPPVIYDQERLIQVFTNLINNAIKFTDSGSVTIGLQPKPDEVLIWVRDTGIGIAPEHQQRIFDRFYQVGDLLTSKPTGTGLGLAICREIVQHHGGRIWVESQPHEGSTFFVTLPYAPRSASI